MVIQEVLALRSGMGCRRDLPHFESLYPSLHAATPAPEGMMDAYVQFLLHHLWPSPAAIRARLPHLSAPGFTAGQHNDASVFASCYSLQSCSPLDQVTPISWRQRLLHPSFPHFRSPQSEVGYHYTANWTLAVMGLSPTGRVLLWAAQATSCQAPFL